MNPWETVHQLRSVSLTLDLFPGFVGRRLSSGERSEIEHLMSDELKIRLPSPLGCGLF
jgi:hypothetical protein